MANRLFSAHGYENVTLRAVAEELGYTHATLYRYFPDKSHLLSEVCRATFGWLVAEFDAMATAQPDPVERLFATSRGFVRFCREHPQHFRTVFFGPESREGTRIGLYLAGVGQPLFERLAQVFNAGLASRQLAVADPKLAEQTWWSAVIGLTMVLIIQGEVPQVPAPEHVVEQLIATLWAGMRASAPVASGTGDPELATAARAKRNSKKI